MALRDEGRAQAALFHDPTIAAELAACLDAVFDALGQSSLPPAVRLVWALEARWRDPADLGAGAYAVLGEPGDPADWGAAADALLARLATHPRPGRGYDDGARLVELAALALERAGRGEEALARCVREAREHRQYAPLLARLPGADPAVLSREGRSPARHDELVAELLRDAPAQAAAIWRELAEAWIAGCGYGEAARALRRLRQALAAAGQAAAWRDYIAELRAAGRRRPQLVATLDALLDEA